jgi:hypothetical protein
MSSSISLASSREIPLNTMPISRPKLKIPLKDKECLWELRELTLVTEEWIEKARIRQIDISEQLDGITYTIKDGLSRLVVDATKVNELVFLQQLNVRGLWCSQIIRKVFLHDFEAVAQEGLNRPDLVHEHVKILECRKMIMKNVPSERCLKPKIMLQQCLALNDKVKDMVEKILAKRK